MIKILKLTFFVSIWATLLLSMITPAKTSAANRVVTQRQVAVVTEFGETDFGQYISKILTWLVTVVASLAALMFIYAGYVYVTSQGNPEGVTQAKDIIIGVITGVLLLFLIEVILVKTVGIKWQYT